MSLVKRLMIAVTLAVSAVFFIPAPAQAGGHWIEICFPDTATIDPFDEKCWIIEIPVEVNWKYWPPDCDVCLPSFDFWRDKINPATRLEFNERLGKGLGLLAESHLTDDEKLAEQFRAEAGGQFLAAAEVVGQYEIALDNFSWLDPVNGKVLESPQPEPALAAGNAIAEGVTILQNTLGKEPDIEGALAQFDKAYEGLTGLAAG
ncbi:hypothetical protein [Glycomyces albidus]|jgi:hypothetical protein|uniref:Uncharacterized protein n=1 Tax=Glycomyces albidus TaxID=2656774 RepID=A0A6L5GEL1_9ACTN|nr:hypothetical protein [Glycomyces albidus]MQM28088.1 hypothetical protein [Glycomyces albidus]